MALVRLRKVAGLSPRATLSCPRSRKPSTFNRHPPLFLRALQNRFAQTQGVDAVGERRVVRLLGWTACLYGLVDPAVEHLEGVAEALGVATRRLDDRASVLGHHRRVLE